MAPLFSRRIEFVAPAVSRLARGRGLRGPPPDLVRPGASRSRVLISPHGATCPRPTVRLSPASRRLAEAYRAKDNIVPPMIEAVGAYLSIGEISRIREEALGEPFVPTTWNFGR